MDFFERQDKARRHTAFLVFYFIAAIVLMIGAIYLVFAAMTGAFSVRDVSDETTTSVSQVQVFLLSAFGTLTVIGTGSFFKTLSLARGGRAVAELLDGRLVNSNSTDAHERKLLNVVEEMAIASGVPVPQVYVMDGEPGINAFAAGHSASDAAVSVTRGAMTMLTRDELQGVIAHEFSHLLNGDMKLNLRLMGLIFGILCLTVIGRILVQTRGRKNPLPLIGLALIVFGWIGVLFGRLIQAAVSRQREFLADASAVQFTRNPSGLAGALKKIGGIAEGSQLQSHRAEEASHLFFANGLKSRFFGFATHPPLIERIRALDPSFDGKYPTVVLPDTPAEVTPPPLPGVSPLAPPPPPALSAKPPPLPVTLPPPLPAAATVVAQQAIVADVGQPRPEHLQFAVDLHEAARPSILLAARDPLGAHALICAFLLSQDSSVREKQLDELGRMTSDAVRDETRAMWPDVQQVPAQARIPLVDVALPALRRLSPPQFEQFRSAVNALVASDNQIDLFEFMLQKIVMRHLDTRFYPDRRPVVQFYDLRPLVRDAGILLSATAYAGADNATQAQAAFAKGAESLGRIARSEIPWLPPSECEPSHLDAALNRFAESVPQIKKNILAACAETVAFDNVIQPREAEIIRAIADSLDCPIPPFLQS
ncbi:MAG TPA: M48 family metallopeptidase [Chthoniobacterales bacterium]|nr:M48 family metallopeptidase [Chthoniobacterales bacterium]